MGLKLFFTYIGSLLAISIALTFLVKKLADGYASHGKKPFFYGTFSSLIASIVAFLAVFVSQNLFTVFWILAAIFMLFGIIHMNMVHKKYFYSNQNNKARVFIGEIFFAISIILFTIVVFSSLQYFVTRDKDFIFYPMMFSTLAFFIPVLLLHTFDAAYEIPPAEFPTWQYPLNTQIPLPPDDPREKLLVIGFEIAKKVSDQKKTYFRAKAPDGIKLGELYYHFLNDYNELQSETTIEFADGNASHDWWFRLRPKWYQQNHILDPLLSVRENGIKENSVIICERLSKN
jgi:hypothetical protein